MSQGSLALNSSTNPENPLQFTRLSRMILVKILVVAYGFVFIVSRLFPKCSAYCYGFFAEHVEHFFSRLLRNRKSNSEEKSHLTRQAAKKFITSDFLRLSELSIILTRRCWYSNLKNLFLMLWILKQFWSRMEEKSRLRWILLRKWTRLQLNLSRFEDKRKTQNHML